MRQQMGPEQMSFEPVKKSEKKTPKTWDGRFKNSYLKNLESRDEKTEAKTHWESTFRKFKDKLEEKAKGVYKERMYDDKESKLALKDSKSILKQVFTEFMKFSVEDLEDIMENDEELKELQEMDDISNTKQKKLEKIENKYRNQKAEAEETIKTLIPEFYELDRAKQEDLLDDMYRKIEKESDFIKYYG